MELRQLLLIIERDIRMLTQYKMFLILRWLWFFIQVAIFGIAISFLIGIDEYFKYYAAGIYVATLYSSAMFVAYDIMEEAEHGVIDYLLSLPIHRRTLEIGRALGGGIRSILATAPPLIFTLILVGIRDILTLGEALIGLFLMSFGVAGLGITIVSILKSSDKTDILLGAMDAFIIRLSTIFYPRNFMPTVYSLAASLNPLTYTSDLFRWGLGITFSEIDPMFSLVMLLAFALSMTSFGVYLYEKRMEGGGWT